MAILLSLETATGVCSAALHEHGKLLASHEIRVGHSAASGLTVIIDEVISSAGLKTEALEGVAISAGPGSYTGLRIGVATAKGICYALGIPLLAVNTLELMVNQVLAGGYGAWWSDMLRNENVLLCPMLDARRMEVYCLLADTAGNVVERTNAKVVDEGSFSGELESNRILFFGNGAEKCRGMITHPNAFFVSGIIPEAAVLGGMAEKKFSNGWVEDVSSYEPLYLKDFVAKKPKGQL